MKPVGYAFLNTNNAEVLFKGGSMVDAIPLYREPPPVSEFDQTLALRMLDLCEYITFHDGRYGQLENKKAYDAAYALAKVLVEKLDVKMYADRERTI